MSSSEESSATTSSQMKYKGVRRRKWGKWVSEIRVPGTQERLWLGSYSSPEAAAVAHDIAFYCLRRPSSLDKLNFPLLLPASLNTNKSPTSIQKAASDAGMAIDAQMILKKETEEDDMNMNVNGGGSGVIYGLETPFWEDEGDSCWTCEGSQIREGEALSISVEDYL